MEQPESHVDGPQRGSGSAVPDDATPATDVGARSDAPEGAGPDAVARVTGSEVPGRPAPVVSGLERRRRPGLLVGVAVVLATATVLLGGLYLSADGDRRDQRRQVAELTAREAESQRREAESRTRIVELEQRLDAEQARFTAVEPCLRQASAPAPIELLSKAERDRLLADAMRNLPTRPGSTVRLGELTVSGSALPACKDIGRHLK